MMARNIGILASKEELEEMYWGQGMSVYQIAPYFNTTPQTIWGWLKHYGMARRPAGGYHWKGRVMTEDEIEKCIGPLRGRYKIPMPSRDELMRLYWGEKKSIRDIADQFNIATYTVNNWFRRLKVPRIDEGERLRRIFKTLGVKPNKSERKLDKLLSEWFPSEWLYNGTGEHMILDGKIPDFININGRKAVIELFGDYWHKGENPEERAVIFGRYGFALLVIWEHELKNPDVLKERIISFGNTLGKEEVHGITDISRCEVASLQGDLHVKWSQSRGTLNQEARESRAKPERKGVETGRLTLGDQMMVQSDLVGNHKRQAEMTCPGYAE